MYFKPDTQTALTTEQEKDKDAKTKIVFILPTLLAGGAERVLITLMNRLDRTRYAPEFIVLDEQGPLRSWIDPEIPCHTLGHKRVRESLPGLYKLLRDIKPEIAVSTLAHMNFALLILGALFPRMRTIVREANIPSSIIENIKTPWILRQAYRILYPGADLVLSPAQCIIDEFRDYLNMSTKNHALLHNPVDTARIRQDTALETDPDPAPTLRLRFVCAGRLHYQKGFDRLIAHLPALAPESGADWRLTILGTGTEHDALQGLIDKHNLAQHVTLFGHSDNPWKHIAAADAFLLPSRWEGLPNVVLESLAAGTPVIATTESGGIGEIAELAGPDNVKLADDMPAFIAHMNKVIPAALDATTPPPRTTFRPSLLPENFEMNAVLTRFEHLLSLNTSSTIPPAP